MGMLLLRLAPIGAGLAAYALFEWQWTTPKAYPWALLFIAVLYMTVVARYVWSRVDRWSMLWNAIPFALFFLSATAIALMIEESFWRHGLSVFTGFVMYMSLELLFLHLYHTARYPVNGLTHLQLGLIPIINAFVAWGIVGVQTFQKMLAPPFWGVILGFALTNGLLFAITSHPDATTYKRRAWIAFGAATGAGIGCLLLFLPLAMPAQAFLAALLIAAPLRVRRYGFRPAIPTATAVIEGGVAVVAFFSILLFSRWA